MVEPDDEAIWIRESQRGNPEAFEALVARYQRMVHSLTFRMTGSLSEAEDLAQETFIQAYHQLGHFRHEAKFSSWLYRIAVNACLNWRRRDRRREEIYRLWSQERETVSEENSTPTPELSQRVQDALIKLHPKQRAAVILTVYEGLNHAQAARALGCSETTVSWRLFAARRKLRRWLNPLPPSQKPVQAKVLRDFDRTL
jgi:RNA polymerase sigma-70 factor (ECF subfamily)